MSRRRGATWSRTSSGSRPVADIEDAEDPEFQALIEAWFDGQFTYEEALDQWFARHPGERE